MDAQISSLIEQTPETPGTPEKGVEEIKTVFQSTPEGEVDTREETLMNTATENVASPPVEDKRKNVTPKTPVVPGDYITSLAENAENTLIDEVMKNNLPNGSA